MKQEKEPRNRHPSFLEKPPGIPERNPALPRRILLQVRSRRFLPKIKKVLYFSQLFSLRFLDFLCMALFCDFPESEVLLRLFSVSELAVQRRDYAAKVSISGRIACERLIE
jgi:hypothetical protein